MAKDRVERRLAAIMATDIVGYSRLIEIDETGTLGSIKRLQSSIFNPTISTHGGRIVKLIGAGALVVFNSTVDAVNCGVSLQNEIALDQKHVAPDQRIIIRIGINLADVVVEGDDLFGDGVNMPPALRHWLNRAASAYRILSSVNSPERAACHLMTAARCH